MSDVIEIEKKTSEIVDWSKVKKIDSEDQYRKAIEVTKDVKNLQKQIVDTFSAQKELAHKAHKAVIEAEKKYLEPLQTVEKNLKNICSAYFWNLKRAELDAEKEAIKSGVETTVSVTIPEVQGVSYRDNWKMEVVDLMVLVKAVAKGQQPISLLLPNETAINQIVKALKAETNIPGVKVYSEKVSSVRT